MSPTDDGDDDDRAHDDAAAFAEAMRGARPLAKRDARAAIPPADETRRRRPAAASSTKHRCIVEQTVDAIAGRAPDVSLKVLRELRAGAHAVEARLDVHGRGRSDALRTVEGFVASAHARGARALLVIHGRGHGSEAGGPVLRPAVWEWLASAAAERCGVMAFASAGPRDGGAGATIVLLRRAGH